MRTKLFFYLSISCLLSSAVAMSAYEVLKSHGLPMGLLPKGVKDFQVDGDGRFEVRLDAACTAKFESQSEVRFNSTVSGTLSYGQIAALSGVAAQELFLWFPVRGIRVDIPSSGLIYFDVGVIYKRFSLSIFETPPDCVPFSSSEARLPSKNRSGKLRYTLDQEDAQSVVQIPSDLLYPSDAENFDRMMKDGVVVTVRRPSDKIREDIGKGVEGVQFHPNEIW